MQPKTTIAIIAATKIQSCRCCIVGVLRRLTPPLTHYTSARSFVLVREGFTGGRVDEMLTAAREAIHQLVVLAMLCRFVDQPAFYAQAGFGAAIKKSSHIV